MTSDPRPATPAPKPERSNPKDRRWPAGLYEYIFERDGGCVAHGLGLGVSRQCFGRLEVDHVRPAPGKGLKSPTQPWNLAVLCGQHHYMKTVNIGGPWRRRLIGYLLEKEGGLVDWDQHARRP